MTYSQKLEIRLKLLKQGIDENDLREVLNAIYTNDYELLQTSLSVTCDILESVGLGINILELKPMYRFLTEIAKESFNFKNTAKL